MMKAKSGKIIKKIIQFRDKDQPKCKCKDTDKDIDKDKEILVEK